MPLAEADFISSLFGKEVSADIPYDEAGKNSQNIALLQADADFMPIFEDKKAKTDKKSAKIEETSDFEPSRSIVMDDALVPLTSHLNVPEELDNIDSYSDQISVYVVREGDSISQIAEMFGVSVNTILSANDLKKGEKIKKGEVLFILPISGVEHTVAKGQTLKSIAKIYKISISDITKFNGITEDAKLAIGEKILIPTEMMEEGSDKPSSNLKSSEQKDKEYYKKSPLRNLADFFINPLPTGRKTQGLHGPGRRGVDIGAPTGNPIYASASGVVLIAKTGWSGGYGNMQIVQHDNGTKTLYAHMSKLAARTGDRVSQGEIIGYVGSTGRSTGPHLHFEVFNAKNPGSDWSWAN